MNGKITHTLVAPPLLSRLIPLRRYRGPLLRWLMCGVAKTEARLSGPPKSIINAGGVREERYKQVYTIKLEEQ
jgi:hypothetical protein